jgi:hypothetical protein
MRVIAKLSLERHGGESIDGRILRNLIFTLVSFLFLSYFLCFSCLLFSSFLCNGSDALCVYVCVVGMFWFHVSHMECVLMLSCSSTRRMFEVTCCRCVSQVHGRGLWCCDCICFIQVSNAEVDERQVVSESLPVTWVVSRRMQYRLS